MSYQVFARKYRPRTFDDVLGQDHVVRTLRNAIEQNRLAHAYLFVGPRGTGKTSTARIFAKALNCPGGPRVDFNPDDPICLEIEKGVSLDVREIDGASNNGVEQVRELREEVKFAPSQCKFKIYYIDEVHMLSTAAFNALLKTLEEPPEHVKFIFATTEAHKVLPTIISRCQRFDLKRIPANLIAEHLLHIAEVEGIYLDSKAAYLIAKGADGGMRDAQSMLDQLVAFCGERIEEQDVLDVFGFTRAESVANLAVHVIKRDTVQALKELHHQADSGKDLTRFLADLIQHFRTLLVHQVDPASAEEDLSAELIELVRAQAAAVEAERILRVMDGLAEVDARMKWANNKLLHLEIGIIQAIQTLGEVTLSEVIAAVHGLDTQAEAPIEFIRKPSVKIEALRPISIESTPSKLPKFVAPALSRPVLADPAPVRAEPAVKETILPTLPVEVAAPVEKDLPKAEAPERATVAKAEKAMVAEVQPAAAKVVEVTVETPQAPKQVEAELLSDSPEVVEDVADSLEDEPPFELGDDLFKAPEPAAPPVAEKPAKKATSRVKVAPAEESLFGDLLGFAAPQTEPELTAPAEPETPLLFDELLVATPAPTPVEEVPQVVPQEPVQPVQEVEPEAALFAETSVVESPEEEVVEVPAPKAPVDFWTQFVERVGQERPLISSWIEIGQFVSAEGNVVAFALPSSEESGRDSLMRATTRKFLERISSEILGRDVRIEIHLDPNLAAPEPEPVELTASAPMLSPTQETKSREPEVSEPVIPMVSEEEFHSDPLIQAALARFKATIVTQ